MSETKNGLTVHLICPTESEARAQYLESFNIETGSSNIPVEVFLEKLIKFNKCPSPLGGKRFNFAGYGTNPYMYNDRNKKVIIGSNGLPEGSNAGIASALAKTYNFTFSFTAYSFPGVINETSGNVTGAYREVSVFDVNRRNALSAEK